MDWCGRTSWKLSQLSPNWAGVWAKLGKSIDIEIAALDVKTHVLVVKRKFICYMDDYSNWSHIVITVFFFFLVIFDPSNIKHVHARQHGHICLLSWCKAWESLNFQWSFLRGRVKFVIDSTECRRMTSSRRYFLLCYRCRQQEADDFLYFKDSGKALEQLEQLKQLKQLIQLTCSWVIPSSWWVVQRGE